MAEPAFQGSGRAPLMWRLFDRVVVAWLMIGTAILFWRRHEHVSARGNPSTPPSGQALKAGYEVRDISARGVTYVLLVIGLSVAFSIGLVWIFIWRFDVARTASFRDLTTQETAMTVTPGPHLQVHPYDDLARVRMREQRMLEGYGWTSADHSTAHIPIERAMALMVGRNLEPVP